MKKIMVIIIALLVLGGIGGYLFIKSGSSGPAATPKIIEKSSVLTDWQSYQSKEYGFRVKYPAGYTPKEENQGYQNVIIFEPPKENQEWALGMTIQKKSYASFIEEIGEETMKEAGIKLQARTIHGIEGVELKSDGSKIGGAISISVAIPYKSETLIFVTIAPPATAFEEVSSRFELFLASFVP